MKLEITIDVDDLDHAVEFYCRGLGLKLVERNPDWARAELDGQTFWIYRFAAGPEGTITRDYRRHCDRTCSDLSRSLAIWNSSEW